MYVFWLPLCYMLAIVSSVLLRFMPSDYPFGIFWPLYHLSLLQLMPSDYPFVICWPLYHLSYFDLCLLLTTLVSFGHCIFCPTSINAFWLPLCYMLAIVSSALLQLMPSDYNFVICWPLYRLSYFDLCFLITPLLSFGHCIVCPTLIYAFWLSLRYLLAIVSSVLLRLMPSDYPFGILWPLYRLSYFDLCLLITPLVSFGHCIVCSTLI
jgi:predicted nucleic acid-binding Zn ribbon protein